MKDGKLKRWLIRSFFPYGSVRVIWGGVCRGMRIKLTPETGHSVLRGYELSNQRFLKNKIKCGMTIYDIGANSGQMTLLFSKLVTNRGVVIAFEPIESLCDQLMQNTALNTLQNVSCKKVALGETNGKTVFLTSRGESSMGKVFGTEPALVLKNPEKIQVDVRTLDSFLDELTPPDLLKIDAEGSAGHILRGAARLLKKHKPVLFIELHGMEEETSVQDCLRNAGYIIEDLTGSQIRDLAKENVSQVWCYRKES